MAKKGYWLASIDVNDDERYKDYVTLGSQVYKKYGAKIVVRAGQHQSVEGDWNPRNVVIEFPSYQDALDCYNSPEYAEARAIRQEASEGRILIIEGHDG